MDGPFVLSGEILAPCAGVAWPRCGHLDGAPVPHSGTSHSMTAMTGSPHPGPSVPAGHTSAHAGTGFWTFVIGPVRVVHGDIGMGPLDAPGAGLKPRRHAARRAGPTA